MKKIDFVREVAARLGQPTRIVNSVVDETMRLICEVIAAGDSISFSGAFTFDSCVVAEAEKAVPTTQNRHIIPAHLRPKCRFAVGFKKRLIEQGVNQQ